MTHAKPATRAQQQGSFLLIVLALILTMGLFGLYMFSNARMQYQMVGNVQYSEQAFNQAEATVVAAERWLRGEGNTKVAGFGSRDNTTPEIFPIGGLKDLSLDPTTMEWTNSNSKLAGNGRYLIEKVGVSIPQGESGNQPRPSTACRTVDIFRIYTQSNAVKGTTRMVEVMFAADGC
jgi:Tfp pilus assembly protein PilX